MVTTYDWDVLYFNVDEERFGTVPRAPPPVPQDGHYRHISYFGESNDHLYLVQIGTRSASQFNVYEMDKEFSGWSVRFDAFPTESRRLRKDDGRNSFIVFGRPRKAIRLDLKDMVFTKIRDFSDVDHEDHLPLCEWKDSIQFVESLHLLWVFFCIFPLKVMINWCGFRLRHHTGAAGCAFHMLKIDV